MQPANLLFILSDQHARDALGCAGHPVVRTPSLDRLAARGVRFPNAYTPCPICVPARAAFATGRYVHQIGYWDNAFPYDGAVPSWHHRLRNEGRRIDSIGKLHFSGADRDHGFSHEIDPLHVVEGIGDILGSVRDNPPLRNKRPGVLEAGPGDSTYLRYDAANAERACEWLESHREDAHPWALYLSFVCPHPPYIAPPHLYNLYPLDKLPMPPQWRAEEWPDHPALDYFRRFFAYDAPFEEQELRKLAAAYYGAVTYLDRQIGRVLDALEELGLAASTRVIYTSDHGEALGARGMVGKFDLYDESAAVPLIVAGPDIPVGRVVQTPVSLIDLYPTVLEAAGIDLAPAERTLPGRSLWQIARAPDEDRTVLSEYHAFASRAGMFMLRNRQYKYIHYVGERPQLFDLQADPQERCDLAQDEAFRDVVQAFEQELRGLLDPEAVDARAKTDQAARVAAYGGVEAVIRRGGFENSPTPGEAPAFERYV